MTPSFAGKVVLITGVGRAGQIGHAVARAVGAAGAQLVIADRDPALLAERAAELTAQGVAVRTSAGDLTAPEGGCAAVAVATKAFGGLDAVINVAGGFAGAGPALEITPQQLDLTLAINLKTTFFTCQAALPALVARGGGAIVNFASIAVVQPAADMAGYAAAKFAVAGLSRALAREFRDRHVRINAVAPHTVRTGDNVAQMGTGTRYLELDDLVAVVCFLASDAARGITGEVVPVTGGAA